MSVVRRSGLSSFGTPVRDVSDQMENVHYFRNLECDLGAGYGELLWMVVINRDDTDKLQYLFFPETEGFYADFEVAS